ncbi:glycosyltransferase family 4 protein [Larsenimonas salina]|uniref:glycosyltransferase family 4 protein n=1 Tax=Larsenimonas salina TaxID=1295565 RepID=UPI0020739B3B|nr:glycosyltransferase family 4 protein [Larsenimonas salina]MCM5703403.1 glycosyltransferase family 4 protein [Larsenimonas salina]
MTVSQKPLAAIAIRQVEKNTGASRNAFEQAHALHELGYRVVILAERARPELINASGVQWVRCWRFPFKGAIRRFWFNRCVQRWVKKHSPALLVSHGDVETPDIVYLHNCVHLASERIYGTSLPTRHEVAAIHDHVLTRQLFKKVAVNSRLMGEDLKARYGISDERIEISYPGYDATRFNPQNARLRRDEMRARFGCNQGECLIGLVTSGNFAKRNVKGFIELAATLDKRHDNLRFLVVGKDDATPFKEQASALGIGDRVYWQTTIDDVQALYGALDVFVLPAHIEEFGRVALEAMACGTPVILSKYVGSAELIAARWPQLVIDPDDQTRWSDQLDGFLQSATQRQQIGNDMAKLATNFAHEKQSRKLMTSFQALSSTHGACSK